MTVRSASAKETLRDLSKDQTRLLELLLEKTPIKTQELRPCPRGSGISKARLPTSWAQQRLWFIDQLKGGGAAYNIPLMIKLQGTLEQEKLQKALDALMQRHEVLRTVFVSVEGDPMQEVSTEARFALQAIDLSGYAEAEREAQLGIQKAAEAQAPFDLRVGPLIRARLLQVKADEHILLMTMHHIVSDGWSIGVILRELSQLYSGYCEGCDDPLKPLPIQYADYAQWQRRWLQSESMNKQLSYWRGRLEGAASELELPKDRPRPAAQGYRGRCVEVVLNSQLSAELHDFARRHGMTLFMVLYAAWAIILARLSGQEDIVIGTPIANRRRPELEALVGLFVGTLVLRVEVSGDALIKEFLAHVKEVTLGAYDNQDMPFEQLVEALRPQRSLNRHPIFQVMFALQNAPQSELNLPGITAILQDSVNETSKLDLLLALEERGEEIVGSVNYDLDILDRETVERWIACFEVLLTAMTTDDQRRICDLPIIPESERRQVTELFNATQVPYPERTPVHELFESQVERAPEALAVVYERQCLTYAELNRRANQLAHYLSARGAQVGEYIPILMPRCLQMLIAQLGVLKSGGVYVPVDPELPFERQLFMIRDCGARIVLAAGSVSAVPDLERIQWIDYEAVAGAIRSCPSDNLKLQMGAPLPAYVMYTSGSTGNPKGVVVPHRAVNRLVINNGYARIDPTDCIAYCSNPAFDASTFEIWGALLNGASVLIVPHAVVMDTIQFAEVLREQRVTILWLTVGLFSQYTQALADVFGRLKYLLVGGDVVEPGTVRRVMRNSPPQHLLNCYGPTECTTFSTTYLIEAVGGDASSLPIGRPISNAQVYILDRYLRPVPIGVAGEIYIGGAGVALGYLNRPELTGERFIDDPFSTDEGAVLYKSGDLGRWQANGNVVFLGRNDQQVKIRGFRIELGEIEAQLAKLEFVKETVVVGREDIPGEKRLVAYVAVRDQRSLSVEELRDHLKPVLPEYMIPSAFVILKKLPLTPNGKVDRRALPTPELGAYASRPYEAPRGEMEGILAGVWQELLRVERVGRDDNFFDLGGNSLLVLRALFKINQFSPSTLSVSDVYKCPTIRELAARVSGGQIEDHLLDLLREAALDNEIGAKLAVRCSSADAVMLTGGTGFVGRFLLAQLLQDTDATIFCLVRARSEHEASSRLRATLSKWDLWRDGFERRIVAIPGDLRQPRLGISDASYGVLSRKIGGIYHCGTSMNHLETYAMAKPANVESARELLKLAMHGKSKVIHYVSTLSVFSPSPTDSRVIDENSPIDHERHLTSNGYAASKWVGEKIFMTAGERGIPCNIFRLGLVWADTQRGRYDELQHGYRIIKSCLLSGRGIRNYRYEMPPTPVDYVARAVVLLANRHYDGGGIFHISSSSQMIEGLFERCNAIADTMLALPCFYDWICELKRLHREGRSLPAVPLMEFAFSMDKESFCIHQLGIRSTSIRFDCARTHRELERAGIVAPVLDDALLRVCIDAMFSRDTELKGLTRGPRAVRC